MNSILMSLLIIIGIFFINQKIENKSLNKQICILGSILLLWIVTRTVKYNFATSVLSRRYLWYFYYFSILYSATIFLNIGTWHNRNKKSVQRMKLLSFLISTILFLVVMTNDFHQLVFVFDIHDVHFESAYTYGIGYYICVAWVFLNIVMSLYSTMKYSKALYRKQKSMILAIIFLAVLLYAIGFIVKVEMISNYFKDFTLIYCFCYFLALLIIVYKEKYRLVIEENLYSEIEEAIKDKTMIINQIIHGLPHSKNKKSDLNQMKLLVSYCKRKSNFIVLQKNEESYSSEELKLLIENTFTDVQPLGMIGAVNIINTFEMPVYIASLIYSYLDSMIENSLKYQSTNVLIAIKQTNHSIQITTSINTKEKMKESDFHLEENNYLINHMELDQEDDYHLHIHLELPFHTIQEPPQHLSDKEKKAVLQIKSKVHDILGQRLSLLSHFIEEEKIEEAQMDEMKPLLNNILDDLNNDRNIDPNLMLNQLIDSCNIAGVHLYVVGKLPKNYVKANTIVKIVRECSTNAIRHDKAQNVYVTIKKMDYHTKVIITNDGVLPTSFTEGDGIKGIKLRVEELKGKIDICTSNKFTITITI